MLDSIRAEYAPMDKASMQDLVSKFKPAWERLKASARPSDMARR